MKYIKDFESINENKKNAKRFTNKGTLGYNDQFSGNIALSKTLSDEFGFDPKKEFSQGVGFDSTTMYDVKSGKTIIDDALAGKHTYDDLVKLGKEWYSKNESAEVNEAKFVKSYDKKLDNAKTKEEVLKLYPKAKFFVGKSDHFFGELEPNLFFKSYYTKGQKEFNIKSVYSKKGSNYIHLYNKLGESLTEAKKFKPGDMWSNDFDYDGMMKYALTVNHKTPIKTLTKLHDSATDVNYHTPFSGLGNAIDWITDDGVNSPEGKDFIKQFHKDIKDEIKRMK